MWGEFRIQKDTKTLYIATLKGLGFKFSRIHQVLMHLFITHLWCCRSIASQGDVMAKIALISAWGLYSNGEGRQINEDKAWNILMVMSQLLWRFESVVCGVCIVYLQKSTKYVTLLARVPQVPGIISGSTKVSWLVWLGFKKVLWAHYLTNFAQFCIRSWNH